MENFGESDYQEVIETLVQTFGQVLSEDVIAAVVESCGGDLNESANAIMNMDDFNKTQDNAQINTEDQVLNQEPLYPSDYNVADRSQTPQNLDEIMAQAAMNYPTTSQCGCGCTSNSNCVHTRRLTRTFEPTRNQSNIYAKTNINWTPQIREILSQYNKGNRILIIMRGVPGSGKSFLAEKIVEMTVGSVLVNGKTHIFSTDEFFRTRTAYRFDKFRLSEAHEWNQQRAKIAMISGVSPVIIDNTNIALWEMEPYVKCGAQNGYFIEVVEPNTPWAKNPYKLAKKNLHGVSLESIKRMLHNFDYGITSDYVIKFYKLSYPPNMIPPVQRKLPEVPQEAVCQEPRPLISPNINFPSLLNEEENVELDDKLVSVDCEILKEDNQDTSDVNVSSKIADETPQLEQREKIEKQLEEFAKVEEEWEKGESWSSDSQCSLKVIEDKNIEDKRVEESKPQRKARNQKGDESKTDYSNLQLTKPIESAVENVADTEKEESTLYQTSESNIVFSSSNEVKNTELGSNVENLLENCQDWTEISMFMSPWEKESILDDGKPTIGVEKTDSSTCVEVDDLNIEKTSKPYKILAATARDINLYYMPLDKEKIPETRMLDKSSMTNEQVLDEEVSTGCINEEKHFKTFRKMFKNIGRTDLRDIFDRCCGDVNWAVSIVLDGMANKELSVVNSDDSSASDDEITEQCECLAAYDIIPNIKPVSRNNSTSDKSVKMSYVKQKKSKKDMNVSESSIRLKRQIEKNVVISDDYYSKNSLRVRKLRRGEAQDSITDVVENVENDNNTSEDGCLDNSKNDAEPSTSGCCKNNINSENSDDDDLDSDYVEKTINIDLGNHFVAKLDEFFGRQSFEYPPNIIPKINIPVSLLNEINALWMESLMDQLDQSSKQAELMLKQDEEFARQLTLKEIELAQAGKEPEVPDLKEIMDVEFALSLYQKDVEEWRNKEPQDLAAKLTREKLYNLFPNISRDVLSELLMAHDNNFQATLEGLLLSTGMAEVLETKNGVNKFVMQKEMERQVKIIEEEKKALSEAEWPFLSKLEKVDMSVVTEYRKEADMHLAKRNLTYQKASEYIGRGMTDVAGYYSEIAALHTRKFEYANSLAAASLIQVHASNSPDKLTVDLHYLRVAEARESLDLFLDAHIQRLREGQQRRRGRPRTLFLITGRGLHSRGPARIKPAVKRRLAERGISFKERNPGLITARVRAEHHLSHQVA